MKTFEEIEKEEQERLKKQIKIGVIVAIGLLLLITFFSSFRTIKSGEVGIKTRFGKVVENQMNEGINFKIPFIEKIVKMNIKVQKTEFDTEGSTKDLQIIKSTVAVNYRVESNKSTKLYKTVGTNYEDTILQPSIKESIKSAIAKYNSEEITTKRAEVSKSCLDVLQQKVKKYGIVIEDFNLTNFSFSEEYTRAIEEKQVAQQNLEKAKLEAETKKTKAQGEAEANALLQQTLTEQVLREKMIEKWNGELPKVTNGNNIFDVTGFVK